MNGLRILLGACAAGAAYAVFAACGSDDDRGSEAQPPNLLLISLDTLRADRCTVYGYDRETTPFLGELADSSVVFERAYTVCAWTLIAHMSMLTGLYPTQHRVTHSGSQLTPLFPTLAQRLAASGYQTLGVHYPGWLDDTYGFHRGFERYESATNAVEAKEHLDGMFGATSTNRPWFLFVHLFDIHSGKLMTPGSTIYDPPPPYDTMFDPEAREVLEGIDARLAVTSDVSHWEQRKVDAVGALYDGGIRYVDDTLRAWFDEWRAAGLLDNTVVVITSDHGEGLRLRDRSFGGHGKFFEEGMRVPLIVHVPESVPDLDGLKAARRTDRLTSLVDLVPTLLTAARLPDDQRLPGVPLDREVSPDRFVLGERPPVTAVWQGDTKLRYDNEGRLTHLVDLAQNPLERRRTSLPSPKERAAAERLVELSRSYQAALFDPGDAVEAELSDEDRAALKGLGYVSETKERK